MTESLANPQDWEGVAQKAEYRAHKLARLLGVSPWQLRRQFKKRFGCSPQHWLNVWRMQAAGAYLRYGMDLKEAASKLHFKWTSYFCRQFKAHFGQTPKQYVDAAKFARRAPIAMPVRAFGSINLYPSQTSGSNQACTLSFTSTELPRVSGSGLSGANISQA